MANEFLYPHVDVMVLAYNGSPWIEDCLRSIYSLDYPDYDTVVIDNGSHDNTIEVVRNRFPMARILTNTSNLGYAKAYNVAISNSKSEFIFILNQDTMIAERSCLKKLMMNLLGDPLTAACTPKILFKQNPRIIASTGGIAFWSTGSFDRGFGEPDNGQYDRDNSEPFAFCGAASLLRRTHFLRAGGFDEKMFSYVEDFDISWRLRLLGFRIKFVPEARVFHVGSASWGRGSSQQVYLTVRNFARSCLKNYDGTNLIKAMPGFLLVNALLKPCGGLLILRKIPYFLAFYRAIMWNLMMLRDTFNKRNVVQRSRIVTDGRLIPLMGKNGIEPMERLIRRAQRLRG